MGTYAPNPLVDLTNASDCYDWLGLPATPPENIENRVQMLITACSQMFTSRIGWNPLNLAAITETYNGRGSLEMALRYTPIIDVSAVTVDGVSIPQSPLVDGVVGIQPGYAWDKYRVYIVQYQWAPSGNLFSASLFDDYVFTTGRQNVVVTYTYGFGPAGTDTQNYNGVALPFDISQAVMEWVAERFKSTETIGLSSATLSGQTNTYTKASMPETTKLTIERYKRRAYIG